MTDRFPGSPRPVPSVDGDLRDWDARTYDRIADPMARWGADVLGRLDLEGDERVLDAGCGTGRVTEQLVERLPRGRVVALDGSPAMLAEARRRLGRFLDRVEFVAADLGRPLPVAPPVDAILSTATFHWVLDHDALFRNLAAGLRPGGQLVAQCGGAGNIAAVLEAARETGEAWPGPWVFPRPAETRRRLEAAGFVEVRTWLQPEPTSLEPGEPLETFLAAIVLREHLARLRPAEGRAFVRAVVGRLARPEIDYVRLNIVARRGGRAPPAERRTSRAQRPSGGFRQRPAAQRRPSWAAGLPRAELRPRPISSPVSSPRDTPRSDRAAGARPPPDFGTFAPSGQTVRPARMRLRPAVRTAGPGCHRPGR